MKITVILLVQFLGSHLGDNGFGDLRTQGRDHWERLVLSPRDVGCHDDSKVGVQSLSIHWPSRDQVGAFDGDPSSRVQNVLVVLNLTLWDTEVSREKPVTSANVPRFPCLQMLNRSLWLPRPPVAVLT